MKFKKNDIVRWDNNNPKLKNHQHNIAYKIVKILKEKEASLGQMYKAICIFDEENKIEIGKLSTISEQFYILDLNLMRDDKLNEI